MYLLISLTNLVADVLIHKHNLPPLSCSKDMKELSAEDRDRYYNGYYPSPDPQTRLPRINQRIEKIFLAIIAKNY